MKSFQLLSHIADIRINAIGDTKQNLFKASLEALCKVAFKDYKNSNKNLDITEFIYITAIDETCLLIDFLSEALTLMHINNALYIHFEVEKMDENCLKGILRGFHVDYFSVDIKAVTYHEAKIIMNKNGHFESIFILDI